MSERTKRIWVAIGTLALPAVFLLALYFNVTYGSPVPPVGGTFVTAGKWVSDKVAPLIGQGYNPSYPIAADKTAAADHCNLSCVIAHMPDDKAWVQVGPTADTGFYYVAPPPSGCVFISAQISRTPIKNLTAKPARVIFDGAPKDVLQECNPKVRLGDYAFGYPVPAWYRSENYVVVSVPKQIQDTDANYRLTVCAVDTDGKLNEFVGDNSRDFMQREDVHLC